MADGCFIVDAEILTPAGIGLECNTRNLFGTGTSLTFSDDYWVGALPPAVNDELVALSSLKHLKLHDRATLMAILLARKLAAKVVVPSTYGVLLGSSRGLTQSIESLYSQHLSGHKLSPLTSPVTTSSALPAAVARELNLNGPVSYLSAACSTSLIAVIHACALMKLGLTPGFLVGGVEASLSPFTLAMLESAKVLSKSEMDQKYPCQPMGSSRSGMVLAEGGGLLLLENSLEKMPIAELIGWAVRTEKSTLTGISNDGFVLQEAIKQCIETAGISYSDIDLIVGHGSGTMKGDQAEVQAYDRFFDKSVPRVFHKWLFGHMLGGSAVVSLALGIKHLTQGKVPGHPYLPATHPLGNQAFLRRNKYMLVASLGFGGIGSCVIVKNIRS